MLEPSSLFVRLRFGRNSKPNGRGHGPCDTRGHRGASIHGCHVIDDGRGFRTAICCKPYAATGTRASGVRGGVAAAHRGAAVAAADLRPPPPPRSPRWQAVIIQWVGRAARRETDNNAQYRRRERKKPVPLVRPHDLTDYCSATVFRSSIRLVTASRRARFSTAPLPHIRLSGIAGDRALAGNACGVRNRRRDSIVADPIRSVSTALCRMTNGRKKPADTHSGRPTTSHPPVGHRVRAPDVSRGTRGLHT